MIKISKPEKKTSQTPVRCTSCKLYYVTSFERWNCNSCGFHNETKQTKLEYEIFWRHTKSRKYIPAYKEGATQDREVYNIFCRTANKYKRLKILGQWRWIKIIES